MNTNIEISYNISALIIIFVIFCVHLSKKKTGMFQNNMFFLFIIFAFATGAFSTICSYLLMQSSEALLGYKVVINNLYVIFHDLMALSFALYVLSITEASVKNIKTALKVVVILPIVFSIAFMLLLPNEMYINYFDEYMNSHRGIFEMLVYGVSIFYLIFGMWYAYINKDITDKKSRVAIYIYAIFVGGASIVEYFVPNMPLEMIGVAVCIMLIFMLIQKPEEFIDIATGLFNKNLFSRMFLIKLKAKKPYTIIIVYVEDMKMLVHAFGIDKINNLRQNIAAFLESTATKSVYTLGTSTFAVMLDYTDEQLVKEYVKRVESGFDKKWNIRESGLFVTARILDVKVPDDIDNLELCYNYIDYLKGLDNSKRWVISAKDISLKDTKRRIAVENAVKKAIESDGFMVYYQPIYSIEENKIVSAEALVRLNDDELGFISPAEFIPISEQNGTILKIGEMVFETVCRFIKESELQKKGIEYVEINLSVVQCMQENLAIDLLAIMKKYGIENSRINLEITETAAAYSPKMLVKNMKYLFENGVCFSLDDFGTGYSNINSLLNLPLDMIKFDKSMIDMATAYDKGKIILGSSIAMVKRMNLKIVAEGVETLEQAEMFAAMGIDYLQGYYFSKPVCEEDFVKYIEGFKGLEQL